MRGSDGMQEALFTVSKLEDFVPTDHPLRAVRWLVNEALVRQPSQTNQVQSIWFSGLGSANAAAGGARVRLQSGSQRGLIRQRTGDDSTTCSSHRARGAFLN